MIQQVVEIVRKASELMQKGGFDIFEKDGLANLVTSSDIAVQHYLTEALSALLPGSGFFCEEEDMQEYEKEYVWIIDPIDGTCNYSRGIDSCCIAVALARKGELQMGVVYSPARNELFTAEKGKGAFKNGKPIHVSPRPFSNGLFCTAMSTYRKELAKTCSDIIYDIYMRCNDTRRWGAAALEICYIAEGLVELYFEMRLQPWDYAAASVVLTEAGGCIASVKKAEPSLTQPSLIIAANCRESLKNLSDTVDRYLK